jgi:heterodisulfide reductase subunit A2
MSMDLLVLMVGMEAGKGTQAICKTLDISNESDGFIPTRDPFLKHNNTPIDGIFAAGACTGPKSVIDTMNDARSAAFQINQYFKNK